jgi:hypothetical protein
MVGKAARRGFGVRRFASDVIVAAMCSAGAGGVFYIVFVVVFSIGDGHLPRIHDLEGFPQAAFVALILAAPVAFVTRYFTGTTRLLPWICGWLIFGAVVGTGGLILLIGWAFRGWW